MGAFLRYEAPEFLFIDEPNGPALPAALPGDSDPGGPALRISGAAPEAWVVDEKHRVGLFLRKVARSETPKPQARLECLLVCGAIELFSHEGVRLADAYLTLLREKEQASDLGSKVERATSLQDELAEVKGKLSNISIEEETLDELEELNDRRRDAQAKLGAAAAEIRLQGLAEDVEFELDGHAERLAAGEKREWQIDAFTEVKIGNLIQIDVVPGGEDLESVREEAAEAEQVFQEKLDDLRVETLEEARRRLRQKGDLESDRERLKGLIEQLAPHGVSKLKEELEAAKQRQEQAQKIIDDLDPDAASAPNDKASARKEKKARQEEKAEVDRDLETARMKWDEHEERRNELEKEAGLAEQAAESADERLASTKEEVADFKEQRGNRSRLEEKLESAEKELENAEEQVSELKAELDDIGAEHIHEEKERAEDALQGAKDEKRGLQDEDIELSTKLGRADLHGLHEKLSKAKHEKEAADEKVERLGRRAEAARLLYETLQAKQRRAQRRHQEPLRKEVQKLLTRFFQVETGGVKFGESFNMAKISRSQNGSFKYEQLSGGAKEQMSLLVRLAMAGIIAEDEPLPVFLDDPLSDTDAARFKTMATILRSMSDKMQIIITTCHRHRYRHLGAHNFIDLEAMKNGSHTAPSL